MARWDWYAQFYGPCPRWMREKYARLVAADAAEHQTRAPRARRRRRVHADQRRHTA